MTRGLEIDCFRERRTPRHKTRKIRKSRIGQGFRKSKVAVRTRVHVSIFFEKVFYGSFIDEFHKIGKISIRSRSKQEMGVVWKQ